MRVLVVEDEVRLAATLQDLLELNGYTVDVCHDGEDHHSTYRIWFSIHCFVFRKIYIEPTTDPFIPGTKSILCPPDKDQRRT